MTEDDTFEALRRKSFNEMFGLWRNNHFIDIIEFQRFLKDEGWTWEEWEDEERKHGFIT